MKLFELNIEFRWITWIIILLWVNKKFKLNPDFEQLKIQISNKKLKTTSYQQDVT